MQGAHNAPLKGATGAGTGDGGSGQATAGPSWEPLWVCVAGRRPVTKAGGCMHRYSETAPLCGAMPSNAINSKVRLGTRWKNASANPHSLHLEEKVSPSS